MTQATGRTASKIKPVAAEAKRSGSEPPQAELDRMQVENARLRREVVRTREQLDQVQGHLTSILSSRTFRYTRAARRLWRRLRGR